MTQPGSLANREEIRMVRSLGVQLPHRISWFDTHRMEAGCSRWSWRARVWARCSRSIESPAWRRSRRLTISATQRCSSAALMPAGMWTRATPSTIRACTVFRRRALLITSTFMVGTVPGRCVSYRTLKNERAGDLSGELPFEEVHRITQRELVGAGQPAVSGQVADVALLQPAGTGDRADHPTVGDDQGQLGPVPVDQPGHPPGRVAHPGVELGPGLALRRPGETPRVEKRQLLRPAQLDLGSGQAAPSADVELAQGRLSDYLRDGAAARPSRSMTGQQLAGSPGPRQIRGDDQLEAHLLPQSFPGLEAQGFPCLRQRRVGLSLPASRGVPRRL